LYFMFRVSCTEAAATTTNQPLIAKL